MRANVIPKSSAGETWNKASMRLPSGPFSPGVMISSPKAKMPGLAGTSNALSLESILNQRVHSRRRWSRVGAMPFLASDSLTSWARVSIKDPFSRPIKDDTAHILGKRLFLTRLFAYQTALIASLGRSGCPELGSRKHSHRFSQSFHSRLGWESL